MSGFKDLAKGGWHPKGKEGGKESWRGDFKGVNTVAGWMGKGKGPNAEQHDHQSAPLSTLKDPASFGPPPKHVNYHGAAATPTTSSRTTGGLGSALTEEESSAKQRLKEQQEAKARAEEEANKPPPGPYRPDTTGLSTANLPKPPVRRTGSPAAKPKLPPRLPPRQNSHPDLHAPNPPPPYSEVAHDDTSGQGHLNQGALDRLGRAGVSVPGLGINRTAHPIPAGQTPKPAQASPGQGPQLSELQSRFSRMTAPSAENQPPSGGTSWADKQAALRTASSLRNDPSKVSTSDMTSAASTANNFRERHGDEAAAGWQRASGLTQKYGVLDRMNKAASPASPPASPTQGKKPPPPPPPKKKGLSTNIGEPPPVPLSSKPKF
ncbi:hypothetical protein EJ04DRAFT_507806 [Polyplosphaeria fusca]|uniref:Uncharacterized protein n=1 Tax=Polyplosphaeria fusca TaxID=682080 RepID=A0A9P4R9W8_9PLEO|nr:hypothetical protein EJ04DRAFT_507806 [Polyplosphaeria fusca]